RIVVDVESIADEVLMRHFFNFDAKVARRSSPKTCVSSTAKRKIVALQNAGRNSHRYCFFALNPTLAVTISAAVLDDPPFTLAGRARLDINKLAEHGASHLPDLSGTTAHMAVFVAVGPTLS